MNNLSNIESKYSVNNIIKQNMLMSKPKYNMQYLKSKKNKLTRNNRNKVRLQQLKNQIKNTINPNIIICVSKKNFLKCQLFTQIMFSNYNVKIISE
jgi:hypothetical protein